MSADGKLGPARPLVNCADVRRPADDSGLDLLSVLTIDLAGKRLVGRGNPAASVVASGDLVYASADRLYVATTRNARRGTPRTSVHSFDIGDPSRTAYTGSGTVVGRLLGRWAMSEYGGDLRVVTTYPSDKSGRTETGIVVLRPRDGRLVPVGSTGGLGRGESVYAVRWFDQLAAIVTFRRIDPLHLVDLTDPERPRVRGELKVPGFSEYLHPIGGGHLLGVGQGPDKSNAWGLQVSTFDISAPDLPTRTDSLHYSQGSSSGVQRDARRFLYLPDARTAVLPAEIGIGGECPEDAACKPSSAAAGLVAVRVNADHTLTDAGFWRARGASAGSYEWRPRVKVLALPGGLLAALDGKGLTVLTAKDLNVLGSAAYPSAKT